METVRHDVLRRVVQEIKQAKGTKPRFTIGFRAWQWIVWSCSGCKIWHQKWCAGNPEEWHGFTEVSASALRLNRIVTEALLAAGLSAISLQPCASAICVDGQIEKIAEEPILAALDVGLIPVIHGDVAFDTVRGGTIVSTEEVMMALAENIRPSWLLLAGETEGVFDLEKQVISTITAETINDVESALGGSRGTDITGGMASKVHGMLGLVATYPKMQIRIFSGLIEDELRNILIDPTKSRGTHILQK